MTLSRSWILLAVVACIVSARARAEDSPAPTTTTPTEWKKLGLSAQFDYLSRLDLGLYGFTYPATNPASATATYGHMQALGGFHYKPLFGIEIIPMGGASIAPTLTFSGATSTGTTISQTFLFDNAPVYGIGLRFNLLPSIRFHVIPSFRWLHADFQGNRGSISNNSGTCTYDFSSNNTSTCVTIGGNTGGGILSTRFSETTYRAGLELSVDIGGEVGSPVVGLRVEAHETNSIFTGTATFTQPLGAGTGTEAYTLSHQRPWGILVGLESHIGPVILGAEAEFLSQTVYSASIGVEF